MTHSALDINAPFRGGGRSVVEVRSDYSTTTEIADALLQKAEVPFRTGHHFASKLTDFGRGKRLKLHEIQFSEVQRIYSENANEALPLSEKEYADIISAECMVFGRKGLGGPQVVEVMRIIAECPTKMNACATWRKHQVNSFAESYSTTNKSFTALTN